MQNIFLAIFFLITFLISGCSSTPFTSGSSPSSNLTSSSEKLARVNQLLEKSSSQMKDKDCDGALKSADQAVGLDSNNANSYFRRGVVQFALAYSCGNNQNPDVTLLRKAIDDIEKSARIFEATNNRENAQIASKFSSNIQKLIQSNDISDAEADQYLSKVKKLYGGEFTILTAWNRLSKKEKVEYGKQFCQWEIGQKTHDLSIISSQLLDRDANYFDSAAEASVLVNVSMEFFCKDKYRAYVQQSYQEFLRSRNQ